MIFFCSFTQTSRTTLGNPWLLAVINFPRCHSVTARLWKKQSAVWVASSSQQYNNRKWTWLLTDYESYQYTSRLWKHLSASVPSTGLSLPPCLLSSMSKCKFIFARRFCLLHWSRGASCTQFALVRSWRGIWKKKKKKGTLSAIQTRDHANREIPSASRCVLCNTGVRTLYTHRDTSHKQTQVRTHRSRESNICTRPALEPQQRAAVLTGATCCYCGLCGKAGLLPAATEWTQYPDSWSHGPRASGPPPACLLHCQLSFQSFISLHPSFNANQCHAAKMPQSEPDTWTQRMVPCVCGRKIKIGPTSLRYFLYRRSIDKSVYALLLCCCTRQQVSSHIVYIKTQRSTQTFKDD